MYMTRVQSMNTIYSIISILSKIRILFTYLIDPWGIWMKFYMSNYYVNFIDW